MFRGQFVGLVGLALVSCMGKNPYAPGDPLGTFRVQGTLEADGCTPGTAENPWTFDVRLSRDATYLYWVQGGLPVSARVEDEQATFRTSDNHPLRPADPRRGLPGCMLVRNDEALVRLDDPPESFEGALTYRYTIAEGSDCADQVGVEGGFMTLPCEVRYALRGTRTVAPPGKDASASSPSSLRP